MIPSEAVITLVGSLLPECNPDDMIAEVHNIFGDEIELELVHYDPGPVMLDMGLFDTLAGTLREVDPTGIPIPMLLPAVTDARHFSRLGIQTYGFLPMNLPAEFDFSKAIHAADERIPVEALTFGTEAIYKVLQRFGS